MPEPSPWDQWRPVQGSCCAISTASRSTTTLCARRPPDNVHTTVIGDNVSPADIAAIARRPANGGSPAVGLAGYAAVSPQLSYVDWRDEVLGLAAELSDGRLLRCP